MKAAVMREPLKPLSIEEVSISKPGPREVLVRLKAAGVCPLRCAFLGWELSCRDAYNIGS